MVWQKFMNPWSDTSELMLCVWCPDFSYQVNFWDKIEKILKT